MGIGTFLGKLDVKELLEKNNITIEEYKEKLHLLRDNNYGAFLHQLPPDLREFIYCSLIQNIAIIGDKYLNNFLENDDEANLIVRNLYQDNKISWYILLVYKFRDAFSIIKDLGLGLIESNINEIIYYYNSVPDEFNYEILQYIFENIDEEYLVNVSDSFAFWNLVNEFNISTEIINKRNMKNLQIINDDYKEYNFETLQYVISDYYFHDYPNNILIKIEAIKKYMEYNIEYAKFLEKDLAVLSLIEFLLKAKELDDDNYNEIVNTLTNINLKMPLSKFIDDMYFRIFSCYEKELQKKLDKTRERITSGLEPRYVCSKNGIRVPIYSIENQTENQDSFCYIIHTSNSSPQEYLEMGQKINKICMSIITEDCMHTYGDRGMIYGYSDFNGKNIRLLHSSDLQSHGKSCDLYRYQHLMTSIPKNIDNILSSHDYNELTFF